MSELLGLNTCGKCRFVKTTLNAKGAELHCQRFPPQLTHVMAGAGPQGPIFSGLANFPAVREDWTCGEFQRRDPR